MGIDSKVQYRKQERLSDRVCRSAVCGGDAFIPDTEFNGEDCQLTCDINNTKQD